MKPKLAESEYFAVRMDLWTSRAINPSLLQLYTCAAEVGMGLPVLTDALSGEKEVCHWVSNSERKSVYLEQPCEESTSDPFCDGKLMKLFSPCSKIGKEVPSCTYYKCGQ